eukprot:4914688-Prymnesium_polylepis.1
MSKRRKNRMGRSVKRQTYVKKRVESGYSKKKGAPGGCAGGGAARGGGSCAIAGWRTGCVHTSAGTPLAEIRACRTRVMFVCCVLSPLTHIVRP